MCWRHWRALLIQDSSGEQLKTEELAPLSLGYDGMSTTLLARWGGNAMASHRSAPSVTPIWTCTPEWLKGDTSRGADAIVTPGGRQGWYR